jgi:hypothetical protein
MSIRGKEFLSSPEEGGSLQELIENLYSKRDIIAAVYPEVSGGTSNIHAETFLRAVYRIYQASLNSLHEKDRPFPSEQFDGTFATLRRIAHEVNVDGKKIRLVTLEQLKGAAAEAARAAFGIYVDGALQTYDRLNPTPQDEKSPYVLEIGAGRGGLLLELFPRIDQRQQRLKYVGIEFVEEQIESFRRNILRWMEEGVLPTDLQVIFATPEQFLARQGSRLIYAPGTPEHATTVPTSFDFNQEDDQHKVFILQGDAQVILDQMQQAHMGGVDLMFAIECVIHMDRDKVAQLADSILAPQGVFTLTDLLEAPTSPIEDFAVRNVKGILRQQKGITLANKTTWPKATENTGLKVANQQSRESDMRTTIALLHLLQTHPEEKARLKKMLTDNGMPGLKADVVLGGQNFMAYIAKQMNVITAEYLQLIRGSVVNS